MVKLQSFWDVRVVALTKKSNQSLIYFTFILATSAQAQPPKSHNLFSCALCVLAP